VQIAYGSLRGSRDIEHIGSAHDDAELAALKAVARQRLAAGQLELDFGLAAEVAGGPNCDYVVADGSPVGMPCLGHTRYWGVDEA